MARFSRPKFGSTTGAAARKAGLALAIIAISAAMSACGEANKGSERLTPPDGVFDSMKPEPPRSDEVRGPVDKPVSYVPYGQGESAQTGNLGSVRTETTYFQKRYNRPDLEAVLAASSITTVNYIKAMGAGTYRVPRSRPEGIYFTTLDLPPGEFDDLWKDVSGQQGDATLAGLYFDACQFERGTCRSNRVVRPIILVDEAGDRWTLVHEMMHLAFDQQRKADGTPDVGTLAFERKKTVDSFLAAIDRYDQSGSREDLTEGVRLLTDVTKLTYLRTTVKELEETAVEAMLLDEWAYRKFQHVPTNAAYNAVWYMNFGRTEALGLFKPLADAFKEIRTEADRNNWNDISQRSSLSLSFIDRVRASTRQIVERAERMAVIKLREGEILPLIVGHSLNNFRAPKHADRDCMGNAEDRAEWKRDLERIKQATAL